MENMNMKLNGETPPVKKKCMIWRKKTQLERYLILMCIVMFIAFLIMIGVVLYLEHVYKRPPVPVCNTALCRMQAGKIMSYIDFDTEPCEDFYKFACGSFPKVVIAPNNKDRYGSFDMARDRIIRISKDVLEAKEEPGEPDFVKQVKMYYKACLNRETGTSNIIEQLLNRTELYHWPILQHDVYDEDNLVERSLSIADINGGDNPYYKLYGGFNRTIGGLTISSGYVFGNEEMFLNDTDEECIRRKEKYRKLLNYVFFQAGLIEGIESEVDEIIAFETLFANIKSNEKEENETETTLKELAEECKEIGWLDVIKYTYDYFGHSDDYHQEIPISTFVKGYLEELCKLFGNSKRRTIYNYLVWRFLASSLRTLDSYFERYYKEIMEDEDHASDPKWVKCIQSLSFKSYNYGLNYMVINHLQPDKSVEEVKQYEQEVRQVMDHMFSVESWLDETSIDMARKRLWNISGYIGYSSSSGDVGWIEKYFSQINVSDSHIENHLYDKKQNERRKLFNDTLWAKADIKIRLPLEVTAYYIGKEFVITLGILQPPFYTPGVPKYLNYPVLAFIIAHELSHAFDHLAMDFYLKNTTEKWPDDIIEAFKERELCYVNQYSQYQIDDNGTMLSGNFTIRDNIADNSGIVQAFAAYEKYVQSETEEPRLPGLDYTNQQMFFISFAQSWCEFLTNAEKVFKNDPHSPGRYRVIGPLQNYPRFSEVFNCPIGSPMNPKDKCRMWG